MRQSQLFTKTRKEAPSDEVSKNAQLLIRAGFVHKEMAGVYDYLPLGFRTLQKIMQVIREEMNAIGGQELLLSGLQDASSWEKSGRWDDKVIDVWFKTKLKNDTEVGLGTTHEEPLTALMKDHINSYKDLPCAAYQFQTKYRNELRAKSGIMRGREFIMKDLYSFSKDEKEHEAFYAEAAEAYKRIFARLGIGEKTYFTFASGGTFSKYSHEFQTICDAGEDTIYIDGAGKAVNEEVYNDAEVYEASGLTKESLTKVTAVEVGNIFTLGTKFSESLGLTYTDKEGEQQQVFMGSYGIGPGRVMGTMVELLSDEKGMVWPDGIAPFRYHLVSLAGSDEEVTAYADSLYADLVSVGQDTLYDDRDLRAGEKFADSDLIGIPWRIVVGKKTLQGGGVEMVNRATGEVTFVSREALMTL